MLLAAFAPLWFYLPPSPPQAALSPQLSLMLQVAPPHERLAVIVRMRAQVDVCAFESTDDEARLVTALQERSRASQARLQADLLAWQAQGLVSRAIPLWIFNGMALTAAPEALRALGGRPDVAAIYLEGEFPAPALQPGETVQPNIARTGAPLLWTLGFRGQGVVVASLDTGVSLAHPDLAEAWRGGENSWYDPYGEHTDAPVDLNGHGTAVMGVMSGDSAGGSAIGMAPEAQWIAARIFNDHDTASESAIHLSYQWLLDPDGDPTTDDAPQVVNNSWTFAAPGCDLTFAADLQVLRAAGILPVFAAGNFGPLPASSRAPANNPAAFAVGAVDDLDALYPLSSRGPSACSGGETYPALVASGVEVYSAWTGGAYQTNSGTSMAAPHVSGGLALLLDAFPGLTAAEQETALREAAFDLGAAGADNDFGHGRLDLFSAYLWLAEHYQPPPPTPTPTPAPPSKVYLPFVM
ncbi:MAG: S8 family serine peptidase, partial [Chloroflexi bacterium]|nr:S8 family serine peptidase [Chloroflexota bacterium]